MDDIRVIKILEIGKIIINKGWSDQINEQMEFVVYNEGEEIIDPFSKKSLGILENAKGTFKVFHIQEKMTTLLTKEKFPSRTAISLVFMEISASSDPNSEFSLIKSIEVGDKVKIVNKVNKINK
jgi:hypothetical protein